MKKESQKARGARDLLPADMQHFRAIESAFMKSCSRWGYKEVRTPTLEYLHLFTSAGTLTPAMLNKAYSFLDWDGWSGERVVLRPDGTIPVARLYMENMGKSGDAKLFYVANMFSFESTGKENREKWQCGVECLGHDGPSVDVEMIALAMEILNNAGLKNLKIRLSHAGIVKALLSSFSLDKDEYEKAVDEVNHGNWQYLTGIKNAGPDTKNLVSLLLNIKGKSTGFLENVKSLPRVSAELKRSIDNLSAITGILDQLDYPYRIDILAMQNFEYYTGLNFQVVHKNTPVISGGRYNDLLPLMDAGPVPACGFALYTDQVMKYIEDQEMPDEDCLVGIKPTDDPACSKAVFRMADFLHKNGCNCEVNASNTKNKYRWTISFNAGSGSYLLNGRSLKRPQKVSPDRKLLELLRQAETAE
jgi:histidyl-tRNA synthetase